MFNLSSHLEQIDEPEFCDNVYWRACMFLKDYGVNESYNPLTMKWKPNPYVFVVTVQEDSTGDVVSGLRVHIVNERLPLPLEGANCPSWFWR